MKPLPAPRLEGRRAADFERELLTRARTWIPSWSLDESQADFGLALLKIAARFNSEVAERLDGAGEKMALGFLDWLGLPAAAARPARVPVVFKMVDTAKEPVLARHPVKLQADIPDADPVTFETETDLQVIPGQLAAIVAVDPGADAYYLPPPGINSLAPLDPLPTAWTLKNFAAAKSKKLQLDPGIGLIEDMLIEIAGQQYRIVEAKDDLVTIEPEVPAGGFEENEPVVKVETFRPFAADGARNLQEHILYIGDPDVLNVEAAANIEVVGFDSAPEDTTWEYWGKSEPEDPLDADARWRELTPEPRIIGPTPGRLILPKKTKGKVESTTVGTAEARWIRARVTKSNGLVPTDGVTLRINPRADDTIPPLALDASTPGPELSQFEMIVNTTPSPSQDVFLFGQEPRLFDTLYIGSQEAFSKPGATAWIKFDLSYGAFEAMTAFDRGPGSPQVLAGVDGGGGLHLFSIGSDGSLSRLNDREAPQPSPADVSQGSASNYALTSTSFRPPVWLEANAMLIAVAATGDVWIRKEWPPSSFSTPGTSGPFFTIPGISIPIPGGGIWEYWGAPSGSSDDEVTGMAVVRDGSTSTLIAQTKSGVFKRSTAPNAAWKTLNVPNAKLIVGMRFEDPAQLPQHFLAITIRADGTHALRRISASGTDSEVFDATVDVDPEVVPFGIASTGTTVVVAADLNAPGLVAWRSDNTLSQTFVQSSITNTILDGSGQVAGLTVYARGEMGGAAALIAWTPFDADADREKTLFATTVDIFPEAPKGPVAIVAGHAFLPGNRKGEIFRADVNAPTKFQAQGTDFVSAFEWTGATKSFEVNDKIVFKTGSKPWNLTTAKILAKPFDASADFYELDTLVPRDTDEDDVFLVASTVPSKNGTVGTSTTHSSKFTLTDPLDEKSVILVATPDPAKEQPVEIVKILDPNTNLVRVKPKLTAAAGPITYRESVKGTGRAYPSLNVGTNNNWNIARIAGSGIYFPDLEPTRQPVIAVRKAAADPSKADFLVLGEPWTSPAPIVGPVYFFVANVSSWDQIQSSKSANAVLSWEYWNGSAWWILEKVRDETSDLKISGNVSFPIPPDIKPGEWAGKTNYWVRARIIAGSYGEAKVRLIQDKDGGQTVDRNTDDLHPPFAVEVRVAYALDQDIVPAFLLTQDSNALRDQSDANRTPGAMVEIFMPLAETLRRLDALASAPTGEDCVPDCDCENGDPSTSPRPRSNEPDSIEIAAGPSTGGRRAIFLGFTSKPLGSPVNLLFLTAKEGLYDAIAPLKVDALFRGSFSSIVADDDSRALGETGLLEMTFDVEPLKSDLFGQALSWLRIAPSGDSTSWLPSIAGIYLNGVWARSAETMTRELVGSSGGQPNLVLTLGRPPLLQGSLELRVREPLGDEERAALLKGDPDAVKYDIADLPGDWVLWKQVGDPTDYGPKDRVYALDEGTGTIRFGDGLHGAIPPADRDSIVAFAYERTHPAVDGVVAANKVKPRQELGLSSPVETVESVIAADASAGGVAPEAAEHVLQFAPATLRHRGRAVSSHDFEDLVRQKSDDVVQARCFVRNGRIRLVVVVRGATPTPSKAQQRELRRMLLESGSPLLTATGALTIEGPKVLRLRVVTKLGVNTLDVAAGVAGAVKSKLGTRFSMEFGGEAGEGWALGREPREEDIAEALLDIPDLESIRSIDLFELDEADVERRWQGPVKPSELVMLAQADIRIAFEILEAVA